VQLMNTDETARRFRIAASGLPGLAVVGIEQPVAVDPAATKLVTLRLQLPMPAEAGRDALLPGSHAIEFVVEAEGDNKVIRHEKSSFVIPR